MTKNCWLENDDIDDSEISDYQIIESLAETIQEEIDGIELTDIMGSAVNLYAPTGKFFPYAVRDVMWRYVATVGIYKQKIVLTVRNTDTHVDANINNPESFDLIFSKIRELLTKIKKNTNLLPSDSGVYDGVSVASKNDDYIPMT